MTSNQYKNVGGIDPDDFANDPELYQAIMASLSDQQVTESLSGWDQVNQNFGQSNNQGLLDRSKQKTPSTNDNFSAKNNQSNHSMDLANDEFFNDDTGFGSNRRRNNNTPRIFVSALEGNENKQSTFSNQVNRHNQPTR